VVSTRAQRTDQLVADILPVAAISRQQARAHAKTDNRRRMAPLSRCRAISTKLRPHRFFFLLFLTAPASGTVLETCQELADFGSHELISLTGQARRSCVARLTELQGASVTTSARSQTTQREVR
jgi:hypothetical protein